MTKQIGLLALFLAASALRADEVNLGLAQHSAIPTAGDSIDEKYDCGAGAFADGKADTAWVTGRDVQDHWARIEWRNIAVTVNRIEIDFKPITIMYTPRKDFFDPNKPKTVNLTTIKPESFELEAHTEGAWKTIANVQWTNSTTAVVIPAQPLTHVKQVRLKLKNAKPGDLFGVRELSVFGPKPETSFAFRPKWKGIWIWGELEPSVANLGIIKRYFRFVFDVKDPATVKSAKLLFVAYDRGQAFLNGSPIGRSTWTGDGMMPQLTRVDVDPKLFKAGRNLFAILGEDVQGWGLRGVLAELWIEKTDGTFDRISTSAAFTSSTTDEPGWNTAVDGFDRWKPSNVIMTGNTEFDTHWGIDFTPPYPSDAAQVTAVTLDPPIPQPGEKFTLSIHIKTTAPLNDGYGLIVHYGEAGPVWPNYMNFSLGEGFIRPEQCLPKGFSGEKTLTISDVWTSGVPPRLPLKIRFCNANHQIALQSGPVGTLGDGEDAGWLKLYVGKPPVQYTQRGFADVKILPGGRLSIDGKVVAPMAFTTSLFSPDRFAEWTKSGVHIFRIPTEGPDHFVPGEGGDDEIHFARLLRVIETQVEAAHAFDPDAKFLLFMSLDMPNDWNIAHPEETILMPNGRRIMTLDPKNPMNGFTRETPNSAARLARTRDAITTFVKKLEAQPYAHSILGIINTDGRGGENYWGVDTNFSLDDAGQYVVPDRLHYVFGDVGVAARRDFRDWLKAKYKTKENLQKSWKIADVDFEDVVSFTKWPNERFTKILMWHSRPKDRFMFRDRTEEGSFYYDFVRHQNEARAQLYLEAGRAIKEASGGRLLASGYIGYVVAGISGSPPASAQHSGHLVVQQIFDSPYMDFIESPPYYHLQRGGDPIMVHGLVDSLRLHDKMWFSEYDTRTYLSPLPDKTFSQPETLNSFRKHFAYGITKDTGWWWLEFPFALSGPLASSWFADPVLLADIHTMKRIYDKYLTLPTPGPSAECAMIFNVEQGYHTDSYSPANSVGSATANFLVPKLFKLGPAVDLYSQNDLPLLIQKGWHKKYKLMLFVNSYQFTKEERALIDTHLKKDGRTLAFFFAPGFQGNDDPKAERQVSGIEQVTGMKGVVRLGEQHLIGCTLDGRSSFDVLPWWDETQLKYYPMEIGPVFYLDPKRANGWHSIAALRLDKKVAKGKTALAQLKADNYQVFYSTLPDLSMDALNVIVRESGVHLFAKPGVLSWSNPYFLGVHGTADEKGLVLTAKEKVNWIEPFDKKVYGTATDSITIDLARGETKFFCLERKDEWREFIAP